MKKACVLLFCFIVISINLHAQLFREEFDETDGATTGMANGVSWSTTTTTCNIIGGDFFEVQGNQFQITDTDCTPTASWTTGSIDVSGQTCVAISLDVIDVAGQGYENEDIIELVARLDGGSDIVLGTLQGDELELGGGSTAISNTLSLLGNSDLVVEIRANASATVETIAFDNVEVSTSTECCPMSSGAMTILGSVNPCGLDGSNEYVVIRNGNNAADIDDCLLIGSAVGLKNTVSTPYNYNHTWNGTAGADNSGTRPVDSAQPCGGGVNCYRLLDNDVPADQSLIASLTTDLNDNIASCNPFVDPGDAIPADALFVVFLGAGDGGGFDDDESNFDFDYLCGFGEPVYLVFGTGTSNGYFENTVAGTERTYRISVNGEDANDLDYAVDTDGAADQMAYVVSPDADPSQYVTNADCPDNTPLPVELTAFYAKPSTTAIKLFWETESELNNAYFEIERSTDGQYFTTIGKQKGAGTTIEPQAYQFVDAQPKIGTNFYRLQQVDTDGAFHYSDILAVAFDPKNEILKVYPSPVTNVLMIQSNTSMQQLQVLDSRGRVVVETTGQVAQVDVSTLPKGLYLLRIKTAKGQQIQRFIKQ